MTKTEKAAWQRGHRARTGNSDTRKYEKTPKGFLMRAYRNMESRTKGIQTREAKYYIGLELLPRAEFYTWALADASAFHQLYADWKDADYEQRLTPSIDRLDVFKGYTLDNMQWLTHSANSGKITRKRGTVAKPEVRNAA